MFEIEDVVNGEPIQLETVDDLTRLDKIRSSIMEISYLFRELVAPFLNPDVLLGGEQMIINAKTQEDVYLKLIIELSTIDNLLSGFNNKKYQTFSRSTQMSVDLITLSFDTIRKYATWAIESYLESPRTSVETDFSNKSKEVADLCMNRAKQLVI
jgi:hypothetical protein